MSETTITIMRRRLALLEQVLALRLPRDPPEGVPFEEFARQVLGLEDDKEA